jgi:S-adenosyl-L-methionine hydrolase (adenosine-forming)
MPLITLTTDFGLKDGNVGVMKGVIWSIAPQAHIADLSHLIAPQNIPEAALILLRSAPYFPDGTIHVVVVDPGVGTARRPIAAQVGAQYYVGPDNGTLTLWLERAETRGLATRFVHLNRPAYWLAEVSHVFHGRDIFAPVAAHLAAGTALNDLGEPFTEVVRLSLPRPQRTPAGWRGEIIHIDHFGNLAANIRQEHVSTQGNVTVSVGGVKVDGMVRTFGERPAGDLVALWGSTGNLIISVVNGSAAGRLNVGVGDSVEMEIQPGILPSAGAF